MKKIIDGALYNTETAKCIGSWDNGLYSNDIGHVCECLYRTKSGKYFLHGEGGGNSQYGVWHGNSGGPGEEIRPYSPAEACQWAKEHLDADDYSAEFGAPAEAADAREILNLSISAANKRKLEKLRGETGKSMSQIVDDMVAAL